MDADLAIASLEEVQFAVAAWMDLILLDGLDHLHDRPIPGFTWNSGTRASVGVKICAPDPRLRRLRPRWAESPHCST